MKRPIACILTVAALYALFTGRDFSLLLFGAAAVAYLLDA